MYFGEFKTLCNSQINCFPKTPSCGYDCNVTCTYCCTCWELECRPWNGGVSFILVGLVTRLLKCSFLDNVCSLVVVWSCGVGACTQNVNSCWNAIPSFAQLLQNISKLVAKALIPSLAQSAWFSMMSLLSFCQFDIMTKQLLRKQEDSLQLNSW